MKIRFTSEKERHPETDQGLKVIYAPARRTAYRLRWYLILLLVASPALWLGSSLLRNQLLIEAPAYTRQPLTEIRALESGLVSQIHVRPDERVSEGDLLVTLDNPVLTARHRELSSSVSVARADQQSREQIQQQLIERATQRAAELENLVRSGAATRGELDQARDLRDERIAALAALQQNTEFDLFQQQDSLRQQNERVRLEKQLDLLQVKAAGDAMIREINVHEGEAAGPGTLIMRMHADHDLQIHVFLDARQRELARPGQELKLRMPDNSWVAARVINEPSLASRLPANLQKPFARNEPGLLLQVETLEPMPDKWLLDNLPLTARFPSKLKFW